MGVCPIFGILTCVHREHFCPPSTSAQNWAHLSWLDQSKRPHLNLGRDRCILFGTGSCMAILSARKIAPWSVEFVYQFGKWGWKSHVDTSWPTFKGTQIEYGWWQKNGSTWSYLIQFAWCHRNPPLQHQSQDQRLYRLYTIDKHPAATLLSPTIPLPIHAAVPLWHISALNDVFGRFSPGLAYFALHLFRTEWNWSKYM